MSVLFILLKQDSPYHQSVWRHCKEDTSQPLPLLNSTKVCVSCQAQVQSQIQVPNPKSKVQRKRNGTGADTIILQATTPPHHPPPTPNFSHLKCQSSDGKRPSMTFLDLP